MNKIFNGLDGVLIYLDDISVVRATMKEHDQRLESVFRRIREHGLSLNLSKCKFHQKEVSYLGHWICDGEITPDKDRTQPIIDYPCPTNLRQLERFLGMVGYHRTWVSRFAELTQPLFQMKRKGLFDRSEKALSSFKLLKEAIAQSELYIPSPTKRLRPRTTRVMSASRLLLNAKMVDQWRLLREPYLRQSKNMTWWKKRHWQFIGLLLSNSGGYWLDGSLKSEPTVTVCARRLCLPEWCLCVPPPLGLFLSISLSTYLSVCLYAWVVFECRWSVCI